ncbi:MAG TPA: hypothetical protein VJZ93_02845 [Candidatus Nanoarchaeia archaeon]|nr:hypothetical protein [Candidatus Nanoarchaeia archaeon]
MSNKIFFGKKAQASDAITWIVATLIVVVVLGISIFATTLMGKIQDRKIFLDDKQKDFLAVKSITSFLSNDANLELAKNANEGEISNFLKTVPAKGLNSPSGGWNLAIEKENETKEIATYDVVGVDVGGAGLPAFEINFESKTNHLKLKFWAECHGKCK